MSDSKSEYASGFSGPVASHLAAPLSPRHEGNIGQAPTFQRVEAFWNSFSCDHAIAALQSVPAFLLAGTSVGPRASGEVGRRFPLAAPALGSL